MFQVLFFWIILQERTYRFEAKQYKKVRKFIQSQLLSQYISTIIYIHMSNPYASFAASDDEEDTKVNVVKGEPKQKRTHQDKRLFKKQQDDHEKKAAEITKAPLNESLPEKTKESHKYAHMERPKIEWKRELGEGHFHDKRSGTGREDRPRKAGGGYGNVGNAKDLQNSEKYLKNEDPKAEKVIPPELGVEKLFDQKPEEPKEPEKLTLEEYYRAKGVDLTYTADSRGPAKKGEVNAEWIKKEKLTVLATKEDLKAQERNAEQAVKHTSGKVGLDIDESDFDKVGFGKKPVVRETQNVEEHHRKGKKAAKPHFTADDFPSL